MRSVGILKTNKVDNYHGISIFLPDKTWWNRYKNDFQEYSNLDFSHSTAWDNFISTLYT